METIKAPNGTTKFIKPDFECKLYEEDDGFIYGRVDDYTTKWAVNGLSTELSTKYNLTPAPIPWYENLGDGILCKMWDYDEKVSYIALVTAYCKKVGYPYVTLDSAFINAEPLTQDEVMKYIAK